MLIERLARVSLLGSAWVLYLLIALSIVSLAIMAERAVYFFVHRDDTDKLGDALVAKLRDGDRRGAAELLEKSPSIEAGVVRPVLSWIDGGPAAVEEALEAEMRKKRRELERGMTFMGTLGNNAPFIGLLGTVIGVIQAFHILGEGQNKQAMGNVMSGISEALVATGVGLVVALPAVVAYNIIGKKIAEVEANVGIIAKQLLALLKSDAKMAADLRALGMADDRRYGASNASFDDTPTEGVGEPLEVVPARVAVPSELD
jgi:biopolymer transport protein ExbB/biopolymer transport protein TolQ